MELYIIRHGETDWNKQGKTMGRTNIPLNELGMKQASIARDKLKDIKFDYVFSSPLDRTYKTAKIITDNEIIIDERLIEIKNGMLEGKTKEEKKELLEKFSFEELGRESKDSIQNRINDFFNEILDKYSDKTILVVTHGGVGINIRCLFEGDPSDGDFYKYLLNNCQILKYEINNKLVINKEFL